MPDTVKAVGNLTYNQLVEKVIENNGSTDAEKATQGNSILALSEEILLPLIMFTTYPLLGFLFPVKYLF